MKIGASWNNAGNFFRSISKMPCSSAHLLRDRCCSKCSTLSHLFLTTHCLTVMTTRLERINYLRKETQLESKGARHDPRPCLISQPPRHHTRGGPSWFSPGDQIQRTFGWLQAGVWSGDGVFFASSGLCPLLLRPLALALAICMGLSSSQLAITKYAQKCGPTSL